MTTNETFEGTRFEPWGGYQSCNDVGSCIDLAPNGPGLISRCVKFEGIDNIPDGTWCTCHLMYFRSGPSCEDYGAESTIVFYLRLPALLVSLWYFGFMLYTLIKAFKFGALNPVPPVYCVGICALGSIFVLMWVIGDLILFMGGDSVIYEFSLITSSFTVTCLAISLMIPFVLWNAIYQSTRQYRVIKLSKRDAILVISIGSVLGITTVALCLIGENALLATLCFGFFFIFTILLIRKYFQLRTLLLKYSSHFSDERSKSVTILTRSESKTTLPRTKSKTTLPRTISKGSVTDTLQRERQSIKSPARKMKKYAFKQILLLLSFFVTAIGYSVINPDATARSLAPSVLGIAAIAIEGMQIFMIISLYTVARYAEPMMYNSCTHSGKNKQSGDLNGVTSLSSSKNISRTRSKSEKSDGSEI